MGVKVKARAQNPYYTKLMIAVSSIIVILFIAGFVVMAEGKMCQQFGNAIQSSPGKSCADIYQINKASRGVSGLY